MSLEYMKEKERKIAGIHERKSKVAGIYERKRKKGRWNT